MGRAVAIQDKATGMFYAGEHVGVSDVKGATTFTTPLNAIACVLQNRIEDAQIFIIDGDSTPVIVPVDSFKDEQRQ